MKIARPVLLLAAVAAAAGLTLLRAAPASAQGAPAVTGVAVTSVASADATYARGETIRVTVTFNEAVDVTGSPALAIDMDPAHWGKKRAAYESGSGTAALVFAHEVVEPNLSTQGIAVLADTLALNGGTIRSASSQADAALAHAGLAHDESHKVDWRRSPGSGTLRDTTEPRLLRGEIDGATMTLTFSEALDPGFTGGRFTVQVQTSATGASSFHTTGAVSVDGEVVTVGLGAGNPRTQAGLVEQNRVYYQRPGAHIGGGLRDLAGNPVRTPHSDNGYLRTRFVDLDNVTVAIPSVTGVAVTSRTGAGATYAFGETIRVTVTFSEAVTVTGTPWLKLDFSTGAGDEQWAAYQSGSGTRALVFEHKVVEPNLSTRGIAVLANTLALNDGAIRSASSQADAALSHGGLAHDAKHKVDWRRSDTRPPRLSKKVVDGRKLTLAFDEAIDGTASLTNDAYTVKRTPAGGSEQTVSLTGAPAIDGAAVTLTLAEAVRGTDRNVKVSYRKSALDAGNRLRDEAGNEVAGFSDEPVANAADTTPPKLVRGEIDGGTVTLYFSEPLDPNSVGVEGRFWASLELLPGKWGWLFRVSGGVKISGNKVTFELGSSCDRQATPGLQGNISYRGSYTKGLQDLAGNTARSTPITALENLTKPLVVTGVAVSSDAGADDTYGPGETIRVRLTFSETMFVTGTPRLKIDLSSGTEDEKWAAYRSGSGTKVPEFAYTVVEPDVSTQGVAVLANTLALNGGAIHFGCQKDADLAHGGLNHDPAHKVSTPDATTPTLSRAKVDGAMLTLRFDEILGASASLANDAFTVEKTPQGGLRRR